jgi:hypothetical protein
MRSSSSPDVLLVAAAKKKPRLQALLDSLPEMSDEDIEDVAEPQWVRQALKLIKGRGMRTQKQMLSDLVAATDEAEKNAKELLATTVYEVRIWQSSEQFIGGTGSKHSWKIQLEPGDSFMIIDNEFVRFGDSVLWVDAFERYPLMMNSEFAGHMTLDGYKGFHRALLNQKHK